MTREEMIKDLIKKMSGCDLFIGKYDAKHGSTKYMNGICTVMTYLAYEVSDDYGDEFNDMFLKNMLDSMKKK